MFKPTPGNGIRLKVFLLIRIASRRGVISALTHGPHSNSFLLHTRSAVRREFRPFRLLPQCQLSLRFRF